MTTESTLPDFRLNQPFVGIASFLRAPICTDLGTLDADIGVLGVPFDEGLALPCRLAHGAAQHPRALAAIRLARARILRPGGEALFSPARDGAMV